MKRIAVIVIGSNSTRLLAADATDLLTNSVRGRVETRLFLGLNESGAFSEQAIVHTAESINQLKLEAEAAGAELMGIYATSASRDAQNASVLASKIKELTGVALTILSGEEEAAYSFFGAAGNETCGAIDIGGGSTEVVLGSGMDIHCAHSLQLGASRLFRTHPINSAEECAGALAEAEKILCDLPSAYQERDVDMPFYLLGGTGTACARMLGCEPEGCILHRSQIDALLQTVSETPREKRVLIPRFPASRIDILPTGMAILSALMKSLSLESVKVTERINADGLLRAFVHKKFS